MPSKAILTCAANSNARSSRMSHARSHCSFRGVFGTSAHYAFPEAFHMALIRGSPRGNTRGNRMLIPYPGKDTMVAWHARKTPTPSPCQLGAAKGGRLGLNTLTPEQRREIAARLPKLAGLNPRGTGPAAPY